MVQSPVVSNMRTPQSQQKPEIPAAAKRHRWLAFGGIVVICCVEATIDPRRHSELFNTVFTDVLPGLVALFWVSWNLLKASEIQKRMRSGESQSPPNPSGSGSAGGK